MRFLACLLVSFLALVATSPVQALVLCTAPDGRTYAGDTPPPGCKIQSEFSSAPAEPPAPEAVLEDAEATRKAIDANAVEAQSLMELRRIERRANEDAEELAEVRGTIERLSVPRSTSQADTSGAAGGFFDPLALAVSRDETLAPARKRERELVNAIKGHRARYDELTASLAKARGSLPPSWPRALRCDRCP